MALLEKTVEGDEDTDHRQIVGIDEVQRLCHGDEHLIVDALRNTLLRHPLLDCEVVLRLHVRLPKHDGRQQPKRKANLLWPCQHLIIPAMGGHQKGGGGAENRLRHAKQHCAATIGVLPLVAPENCNDAIPRRWDVWKIEPTELAGRVRHCKDHGMLLPLQSVFNAQLPVPQHVRLGSVLIDRHFSVTEPDRHLLEDVHHIGICSKKNVQAGLSPIPIFVLPGCNFSPQHVPSL